MQRRSSNNRRKRREALRRRAPLKIETLEPRQMLVGDVVVSEWMASNDNTLLDFDDDSEDWVELHNTGTTVVDLQGWYLTDDIAVPTKWQVPVSTVLAPQGRVVIFASNKDFVAGNGQLHTNFKLTAAGDYLALVGPNGLTISWQVAPQYPPQFKDISFGTDPVSGLQVYMDAPTPGAANNEGESQVLLKPTFSVSGGTFSDDFDLVMTSSEPAAEIRYTMDGSAPTAGSTLYTGAITIVSSTSIRVRAYKADFIPSSIVSEAYVKLAADATTQEFTSDLPVMVIDTFGAGHAPGNWVNTYMALFEPDGVNSVSLTEQHTKDSRSALKIRGSSSAGFEKRPYALELRKDDSDDGRNVSLVGMPKESDWVLHGPFVFDRSFTRNAFIYDLSNQVGQYATRTRYVELFVNGGGDLDYGADYRGVYVLTEKIKRDNNRVDIEKLSSQYTTEPEITGGYIFKVDRRDPGDGGFSAGGAGLSYVEPKEPEIELRAAQQTYLANYINEFAAALNSGDYTNPTTGLHYSEYIDVQSWVEHHLLNELAFNVDAFRLSSYFYKPQGGKIVAGPIWDFDRSMESGDGRDDNPNAWYQSGSPPWWNRIFTDPEFRQMYIDTYTRWRQDEFSTANINATIDRLANEIGDEAAARNFSRWGGLLRTSSGFFSGKLNGTWRSVDPNTGEPLGEVEHHKAWLEARTDWLDSVFLAPPTATQGGVVELPFTVELLGRLISPPGVEPEVRGPVYYTLDGSDPRGPDGQPSATATLYTAPFELTDNTLVTARSFESGYTTQIFSHTGVNPWSGIMTEAYARDSSLKITEINYEPLPPNNEELAINSTWTAKQFEFIEFQNTGDTPFNLVGTQFTDGIEFVFPAETLGVEEFLLVVRNQEAFEARYGDTLRPLIIGEFVDGGLGGSDTLVVEDILGVDFQSFTYDNSGSWPERADGKGSTLEVIDTTGDYNDSDNWRSSAEYNGSPGAAGIGPDNRIVVSEVLSHTDAPLVDSIELYNTTDSTINVSGWYLSDSKNDFLKYQIPEGTNIVAGGYLVFDENDFNVSLGVDPNDFALDGAHGDDVYLLSVDEEGEPHRFVEHAEFAAAFNGVTLGRWPDENGDLIPMRWRTLGADNSTPMLPDLMISEIHYNPAHATPRAWTKQAGNWQITGGHLESFGDPTGTVNYLATLDAEQTDVTVDVTVSFPEELNDEPDYGLFDLDASGIIGRYNNSFDFLVVGIRQFSDEVGVWKYAGIWTEVVPPIAIPDELVGDEYRLSATFDGTMITVSVDGVELISADTSINATDTQFGLRAFSEGDQFDDFLVTPLDGSPLTTDSFSRDSTSGLGVTDELGDDLEFVEIYNPTSETIDLTGWRLRKGVDYDFVEPGASAVSLDAGETIVVLSFDPTDPLNADRTGQFRSGHGIDASVVLVGPYSGKLSNKGEAIELQRPDTPPLLEPDFTPHVFNDRVKYEVVSPWPEVLSSFDSLNRVTPNSFGREAMSWVASVPTPGSVSFAPVVADLLGVGSNGNQPSGADAVTAVAAGLTQIDIYLDARLSETDDIKAEQVRFVDGVEVIDDPDVDIDVDIDDDDSATLSITFDAVVNAWIRVTLPASMPEISADLITYVGSLRGDIDGSGEVGVGDLAALFLPSISSDLTGDGRVGAADLATVLASWGTVLEAAPTGDQAMGDAATGEAAARVVDAAIIELTVEPTAMGPLPTFIAEPISNERTSPQRTRRAVTGPVIEGELSHTVRRRRSRIATDAALDDAATGETGPLIRSAGRRR